MGEEAAPPDEIRVLDRGPILVVEFSGFPDDDAFRAYLQRVEDIMQWRNDNPHHDMADRSAVLFDTTDSTKPVTAAQRKLQSEHMARMKTKHGDEHSHQVGVCFVIKNTLIRGVFTAMMWLNPFQKETIKVVATRAQADEWCRRWVVGTHAFDESMRPPPPLQ